METSRPQPDHDESAAGSDTGGGYPEEQQGGANPGHEKSDREAGDPSTAGKEPREPGRPAAPTTDGHGADSGPGTATGNPAAAG